MKAGTARAKDTPAAPPLATTSPEPSDMRALRRRLAGAAGALPDAQHSDGGKVAATSTLEKDRL